MLFWTLYLSKILSINKTIFSTLIISPLKWFLKDHVTLKTWVMFLHLNRKLLFHIVIIFHNIIVFNSIFNQINAVLVNTNTPQSFEMNRPRVWESKMSQVRTWRWQQTVLMSFCHLINNLIQLRALTRWKCVQKMLWKWWSSVIRLWAAGLICSLCTVSFCGAEMP